MALEDEKIVVVDDDDFMRQMLVDTLKSYGASDDNVRGFANGVMARAFFQEGAWTDAVVVCDIAMPSLSGLELYEEVHPQAPDLKFIFMTALELSLSEQRFLKEAGLPLLRKPFSAEELVAIIERLAE